MEIRNYSISQNVKILISSDFTARFIFNIIQYLALQSIVCYSIHNPKLILPECVTNIFPSERKDYEHSAEKGRHGNRCFVHAA